MFIDRNVSRNRLRSNERNGAGVVKLYLTSAHSNGAGRGLALPSINITPLRVKPVTCLQTSVVEIGTRP